jgi:hypothetical protein
MKPQQWVNAGPDEGALHALVGRIARALPIAAIDEVWVFPTRRITEGESTVAVVAAFDENDERRRVCAFRFVVSRNRRGEASVQEFADEFGSAPSHAIARVIEGVLRRLGDDAEVPPHGQQIRGARETWEQWVREMGGELTAESAEDAENTEEVD